MKTGLAGQPWANFEAGLAAAGCEESILLPSGLLSPRTARPIAETPMNSDELYFLPRGAYPVAGAEESQQTGYWVLLRDVPREELEVGQACRIDDAKLGHESNYAKKDFPRFERIKVFPPGSGGNNAVEVDRRIV